MKKNVLFQSLFLLMLASAACRQTVDQALLEADNVINVAQPQMLINATIEGETETRTILGGGSSFYYPLWSEDDEIAVYSGTGAPVKCSLQSGVGSREATFGGNQLSGELIGLYPYSDMVEEGYSDHVLTFELPSSQQYVPSSFGLGSYPMVAVSQSSTLTFKNLCAILKLSLTGSDPVTSIRFHAHAENRFVSGKATVRTDYETVPELVMSSGGSQDVTLLCDNVSLNPETPTEFFLVVPPGTYTGGFDLVISSATGEMTKSTNADITFERSQYRSIPTFEFVPVDTPEVLGMVDMGLSVKWATCNLGAASPEEYGNYYSWAETRPKENFSPLTYSWFMSGGLSMITKYCFNPSTGYQGFSDHLVYLQPEDDAAHVELGGKWRVPTKTEFEELLQNSTITKTTLNGVDVFELVSKINGNHIFIPAVGYKLGTNCYDLGDRGLYWSADLGPEQSYYAPVVIFIDGWSQMSFNLRYCGSTIRPVYGDPIAAVSAVSLNRSNITMKAGDNQTLIASVQPSDAYYPSVAWSSSDTTVATVSSEGVVSGLKEGNAWITVTTMDGGKTASCEVIVGSLSPMQKPEPVDLGLSVKWASFNLGASKPEEYGDYYAWGETKPYYSYMEPLNWRSGKESGYAWNSYSFNPSGDGLTFTKYTGRDYSVLQRGDDAATCNLGENWRVPTDDEQYELRFNCTWEWTTVNNVNGYKVTGSNGNSIFLPAAGYMINNNRGSSGTRGFYWSSILTGDDPSRACFFGMGSSDDLYWSNYNRFYGYTIRPVYIDDPTPNAKKCIVYTSTDGKVVTPSNANVFGANIVSNEYANGIGIITFDGDVQTIGTRAFSECSTLSSIVVPESAKSIGFAAFAGCHKLASIRISESVTSIGAHAFESCNELTEVVIPESVTVIADRAFQFCHALTSIYIPTKVSSIGVEAFIACESLSSITVAGGNTVYDSRNNCNAIIETSTNTLIAGCRNTVIPQSVVSINDNAFYASLNMTQVVIPEGVKTIGYRTFAHCYSLTSVSIPATMESIGGLAFETNSSLTQMIVFALVPPSVESNILSNSYNCKIYVPAGSLDDYKTAIGWSTYANRIFPIEEISISVPEVVDLGLSVKWGSFNLGASKPEGYGDYFGWGETEPYYISQNPLIWKTGKEAGYGWSSYKWCRGTADSMTKYCTNSSHGYNGFVDNKTTLEPEDDAACVHLGGKWRMPTRGEWDELRTGCTWEWTSLNGVNGCQVTGPNGNSIFLPAAGLYSGVKKIGSDGGYWSSSLIVGYSNNAYMLNFYSGGVSGGGTYRYGSSGQAIRPVYAE